MQPTHTHTILVVDDHIINLKILTAILEGADYTVITGSNSQEALDLVSSRSPDIILLDIMMPGMNGFTLCRKLKNDPIFSDIPLIFITSLSQKKDIVEGFNAGGNDYIIKPFNQQELLARVRNHLHLYDMLKENKRLIKLSEDASRSKTEFLASMSHEIRTPLNSIIGMAEVLAETPLNNEQQEYVQIFGSAGESLLEIINDILDLSKIEAGQTELEDIDFHLPSLLDSVISILSVRAAEKNTPISLHIHPNVPVALRGDPTRLRQILINLVGNGLKFTENGKVHIAVTTQSNDTLLFSVKDSGIGIPKEKQELIFESFTQADSLTTRKYGGTGLGLTICKKLTTIMNGDIWLESSPGSGSTFFFTSVFSAASSNPCPISSHSAPSPNCKILTPAQILIVDDNEDNRKLLSLYLMDSPLSITTAENGAQAVEIFKHSPVNLVFMDIEMPVMDGYAATQQMRRWEKEHDLEATPIIALTAHAFVRFKKKCIAAGCSDYLTKPVRKNTLISTLLNHLNLEQVDCKDDENRPSLPKPPKVLLDPQIKKLIPQFLKNKRQDAHHFHELLEHNELKKLTKLSHTVKGTSRMYGFKDLGDLCFDLEQAAENSDTERAQQLIVQIEKYLNTVQLSYAKTA